MNNQSLIAQALHDISTEARSLLVVGLTGRTGSGCTTVAEILATDDLNELQLPPLQRPPRTHEDRKTAIVRMWAEANWKPFTRLNVTDIIAYFAIREGFDRFQQFTKSIDPSADLENIKQQIEEATRAADELKGVLTFPANLSREQIRAAYQFFFAHLPTVTQDIKKELSKESKSVYTKVFQALGDTVRFSGRAFVSDIVPARLLTLPKTIGEVLMLATMHHVEAGNSANYFVVEALRHPHEIRYLRRKITPFYVFAVRSDEQSRRVRLQEKSNMTIEEIETLDEKEYPTDRNSDLDTYGGFVSQNIQACLDLADVHLSNVGLPKDDDFTCITSQIVRYVSLVQHPGLITPTSEERCMQVAYTAKLNSGCISRQVGAVVTNDEGSIQAVGWNDVPRGQVPCLLRNAHDVVSGGHSDSPAYSEFEKKNAAFK